MMETTRTLEKQKKALLSEIQKIDSLLEEKNKLTVKEKIAEELHSLLCHENHTDGCSWSYENWAEPGYAKTKYLMKAEKVLAITDSKTIVQIVDALKESVRVSLDKKHY